MSTAAKALIRLGAGRAALCVHCARFVWLLCGLLRMSGNSLCSVQNRRHYPFEFDCRTTEQRTCQPHACKHRICNVCVLSQSPKFVLQADCLARSCRFYTFIHTLKPAHPSRPFIALQLLRRTALDWPTQTYAPALRDMVSQCDVASSS